jgi:hypothetical protein
LSGPSFAGGSRLCFLLAGHCLEQIDGGDDPNQCRPPNDRQATEATLYHQSRRPVGPGFRRHREDPSGHDLPHLHLRCRGSKSCHLVGWGKRRGEQLTKIAIGDDPDKPLSLDDREVADLMGVE